VDNKKNWVIILQTVSISPLQLNVFWGQQGWGCGEWRFWCSQCVPVKFTMVPNQLRPFFSQKFLVCVEIIFFQLEKMIKFTPKKDKQHEYQNILKSANV
jgi:hypothetical protein